MDGSLLEQRLRTLIACYRDLEQEKLEMSRLIDVQAEKIAQLEASVRQLRGQIDELGSDRFSVKQLKDERKVIRRKLEGALQRLQTLEEEL